LRKPTDAQLLVSCDKPIDSLTPDVVEARSPPSTPTNSVLETWQTALQTPTVLRGGAHGPRKQAIQRRNGPRRLVWDAATVSQSIQASYTRPIRPRRLEPLSRGDGAGLGGRSARRADADAPVVPRRSLPRSDRRAHRDDRPELPALLRRDPDLVRRLRLRHSGRGSGPPVQQDVLLRRLLIPLARHGDLGGEAR